MKLSKGKLTKIYNKKKQTKKKRNNKVNKKNGKTFRKKKHFNLNTKTLKEIRRWKKGGAVPEFDEESQS